MTQDERLKVCSTCKNKRVTKDHETVCALTKEAPAFEVSCPSYSFKDSEPSYGGGGTSSWRMILSILIICIALVRIAVRCNKSDRRESMYQNTYQDYYGQQMQSNEARSAVRDVQSSSRDQMSMLSEEDKELLGVHSVKKDSIIHLSKKLDFIAPSGNYIMKNLMVDELKIVMREPQNYMILVHKFPASDTLINYWKNYRSAIANETLKTKVSATEDPSGQKDYFNYTIENGISKSNGRARIYNDGKFAYILQCEHPGKEMDAITTHLQIMEGRCMLVK